MDVNFTAEMENDLDKVEEGKEEWTTVVDRFYKPFAVELEKAEEGIEKIQIKDEPAGFDCDVCGHPMVIKLGRYGKLYACSNFPDCRNTKPIIKEIGVECPVCHKGQVVETEIQEGSACSTDVHGTQTVTLLLGINQLAGHVRKTAVI